MQKNTWSDVKFFHEGDDFFSAVVTDLRRAKNLIQIETYIFDQSDLTKMIFEELGAARQRECEVQLVVDGFGSFSSIDYIIQECQKRDITLRIYKPLFRSWSWFFRTWTPNLTRFTAVVRHLHRRNHRKVILIDQKIAFIGSVNFSADHSAKIYKNLAWRDTTVRLEGTEIETLESSFREVWSSADFGFIIPLRQLPAKLLSHAIQYRPVHSLFRINFQPGHRRWLFKDLLHRIRRAKQEICIATAYFLPRRSVVKALEKAAKRGVNVEIILPALTDAPFVKWAAVGLVERLERSGVKVYEYQNRVLHAKYILIDAWGSVGSSNFNHRSFMHDLEVEAVFEEPKHLRELRHQFDLDIATSLPYKDSLKNANLIRRYVYRLAFRLRYLF